MSTSSESVDRTQNIINTLNELKRVEDSLYSQLETVSNAPAPDRTRQAEIIRDIKSLNKTRAELYRNLNDMYIIMQTNANTINNSDVFKAQQNAIKLIEAELDKAKKNKEILESDKNNKLRMSQINTYYSKYYEASTDIMKIIIYVSIPLLILAFLKKRGLILDSLNTFLTIIILSVGGINLGKRMYDMLRRTDYDFDKFNWQFDADAIDSSKLPQNGKVNLGMDSLSASCYGPGCCDGVKTIWNDTTKKCDVNTSSSQDVSSGSPPVGATSSPSTTPSS
jgi:hypothetical protein